jgi:disulfide bond formation protein DsbB
MKATTHLKLTYRWLYFGGFAVAVALMAAALFFQYAQHLEPCPLCIVQRWFVIAVGLVLLAGALHNPPAWGQRVYGLLTVLFAGLGAAVAARHAWIQNLPPFQQPGCGADLDTMLDRFPLLKAATLVWAGTSDCATVTWSFLGFGMPAWVLVFFVGFAGLGIFLVLSRTRSGDSGQH